MEFIVMKNNWALRFAKKKEIIAKRKLIGKYAHQPSSKVPSQRVYLTVDTLFNLH
jgi:hypothetical protein